VKLHKKLSQRIRKKHICFSFHILFSRNRTIIAATRHLPRALSAPKIHLQTELHFVAKGNRVSEKGKGRRKTKEKEKKGRGETPPK